MTSVTSPSLARSSSRASSSSSSTRRRGATSAARGTSSMTMAFSRPTACASSRRVTVAEAGASHVSSSSRASRGGGVTASSARGASTSSSKIAGRRDWIRSGSRRARGVESAVGVPRAVGVDDQSSRREMNFGMPSPPRSSAGSSEASGDETRDEEMWGGARNARPRRKARTKAEREQSAESYEWSAWASSCGITSIAITATYFRIIREVDLNGGVFPVAELVAQLALIAGAAVGMEFYARYAHKHLWHASWWSMSNKYRREWNRPIWLLHESHHLPREGAFEANDVFALVNGVPAFALCAFGFFTPGVFGGLCFGAGMGITLFGIAYMYVHDGLVHKRFPTGPLGKLPLLKKIAAGHTIHHTEAFEGVPWGLFLGIQELEAVPGGLEELDKVLAAAERKDARDEAARVAGEPVGPEFGVISQGEHIPSLKEAPACKLPIDA